jgi:hypothetical protein
MVELKMRMKKRINELSIDRRKFLLNQIWELKSLKSVTSHDEWLMLSLFFGRRFCALISMIRGSILVDKFVVE